ncbi:putative serine/threonine protein kinase-20 [Colletotrichum sublineola]|uniref:Putative serine/threonine protein kinase-20 n=1 Tax=Colletotrichum sublineola TaxID=1173701 RepID=A0A066XUD6_COLSU|nr:putative serine/threonine protein kinase-20 [Colletotrichum sublineola]
MSSLRGESTQSFSDSTELQRRIDQVKAEYRESSQLAGQGETCTATKATTLSAPVNVELTEVIEAFANASLASLPDARLIFACCRQPRNTDSAMIPLPHKIGGWNMVGVVQRTHDVNFTLCVPLDGPPCDPKSTRLIPLQLRCSIYYDPADDDCVLVNKSCVSFYLTSLCSSTIRRRLSYDQTVVIKPGMWRISVEVNDRTAEQHLVDFLVQRRQFTITLHESLPGSSSAAKRLASGEEQIAAKRRRLEGDVTEVILTTATDPTCKPAVADVAKSLVPAITTSRKIARAGGTPILDLSDGGVAPNIISLKAFNGRVFAMLVEELPPSLHRGLHSPFKPSDAHTILDGTSSALAYLADQRVIHNDIKPANIAYSPERGAVLLDFGLATTIDEKGLPGGTPWYIPPDLVIQRTRGTPGDVWALGITMLYVLGKITLPERTTRGWLIRNVTKRHGEARERLLDWLDIVACARAKLDRTGMVENTVFQMLEPGSDSRIQATQIAADLQDLRETSAIKPLLQNLQPHSIRNKYKHSRREIAEKESMMYI